jgi:hypothetical protein
MGKVFRLHEGQIGSGWFVSNPITNEQLKTILTEGTELATSIPTPFARIDLFKTAFKWVTDNGINGETAYHKLVSEAFDVAQLFFFSPLYDQRIKIVSWSPQERLNFLKETGTNKHKRFANTISVFWNQDGDVKAFGFDRFSKFYFLLNQANEVIGGTSPATLFCSAPDAASKCQGINTGEFRANPSPLHLRDPRFIKYIFTLQKQPNFAEYFPEVYAYLDKTLDQLPQNLRVEIAAIQQVDLMNYPSCVVNSNLNDVCEVSGIRLATTQGRVADIETESDFVIKTEIDCVSPLPLVLPNERFTQGWIYTTDGIYWNENTVIQRKENRNSNRLPGVENEYPWLTIDDFFEDKLIKLDYRLNSINYATLGSKDCLLPLTPLFFKFFTPELLKENLEIRELAGGGVQYNLKIPVRKGEIVFKKLYHSEDIVKCDFHLAIFPFIKIEKGEYFIGFNDFEYQSNKSFSIETYLKGKSNADLVYVDKHISEERNELSKYVKSPFFDIVRVLTNNVGGVIIPTLNSTSSHNQLSFAIDFGTTNTHIEYKINQNASKAFDLNRMSSIWQSIFANENTEPIQIEREELFDKIVIPHEIGKNSKIKFPLRTSIAHNISADFTRNIDVFLHISNYLLTGKSASPSYLKKKNNIKWSNYDKEEDKIIVEKYIEYLLRIIYYKTIIENGDLTNVKVYWFYPVSMAQYELNILANKWELCYKKVFGLEDVGGLLISMPESTAPFMHYKATHPGLSLSIDIGGGSSDLALFNNASVEPEFISSFRFAGNSIFGDGFEDSPLSGNSDSNGFVFSYKTVVENYINGASELDPALKEIYDDIIYNSKRSSDFSDLLFSLEENENITFNYTNALQANQKLKLPILIFYGAISYYAAKLLMKTGTDIPQNILLSGSASKSVKILCPTSLKELSNYIKFILEKVNNSVAPANFLITLSTNPKEITCVGALNSGIDSSILDNRIIYWPGGNLANNYLGEISVNNRTITDGLTYSDIMNSNDLKMQINHSISEFFDIMDSYVAQNSILNSFDISDEAYVKFKESRNLNLLNYLEYGIKSNNKRDVQRVEETLFFFPLIGLLNSLSFELAQME